MSAAALLREARRNAGLTQVEVARRAGMSQPVIARMEALGSNPTISAVQRALAASGCTLALAAIPQVDETQIAERLRLSPAERLTAFQGSHRNLRRLVAQARRVGAA